MHPLQHMYTETIIKGEYPKFFYPKGVGLVLEGGGTRGFFSAGVLEAFMEKGLMFHYIVGVSAGTANAMSYVSGQKLRNRQVIEKYVWRKEYVSFHNFIKHRSLFGYDFIFKTIPSKHVYWDTEVFTGTDIRFLVGAFNVNEGVSHWFEKHELGHDLSPSIASCSVPLLSQIVKIDGKEYLDGGIGDPIPIEKSLEDGNTFNVIVLTRNEGHRIEPLKNKYVSKFVYRKYPKLIDTLLIRHEVYDRQAGLAETLDREKKALIIRPQKPLAVGRSTRDTKKLLDLHDEGYEEGVKAIVKLEEYGIMQG